LVFRTKLRDGIKQQAPDHKYLNTYADDKYFYVGGNYQAWYEWYCERFVQDVNATEFLDLFTTKAIWLISGLSFGDIWKVCPAEEIPKALRRYTSYWVTDRAVSHEAVRHTTCDFLQESQRYCAYKDELEFISIDWWAKGTQRVYQTYDHLVNIEYLYQRLLDDGAKPEQARAILPNCTATRFIMTSDTAGLDHFFEMRCQPAAYKPIRDLAMNLQELMVGV